MALKKGDFIRVSYTGKFEEGRIFDTTDEEVAKSEGVYTPQGVYGGDVVVVGCGHTIAGLDAELVGKEVGCEGSVVIGPENAFGMPDEGLITSVSTSKFKDGRANVGMIIEQDGRQGVVTKVIGRRATIDFNSPLAGKTVVYDYKIEAVLSTREEKIRGLFALYTGLKEIEVEFDDTVAKIYIPRGITFNQRWLIAKGKFAKEILDNTDMTEIQFIERVTKEQNEVDEIMEKAIGE
ncbi:peptidylprolyl isomerase [Methanolapillus millepedarum]|uniref:Peptidyl-prolyl cis-trans isomerase n=1 Tax=Methanolapillus millepedarum TaxID=3028296 RepID=A0AA96V324_9EURY|nr:hypothetical protein MsAc7_00010 [Methanosarcinaceae archaeon Ac7]